VRFKRRRLDYFCMNVCVCIFQEEQPRKLLGGAEQNISLSHYASRVSSRGKEQDRVKRETINLFIPFVHCLAAYSHISTLMSGSIPGPDSRHNSARTAGTRRAKGNITAVLHS